MNMEHKNRVWDLRLVDKSLNLHIDSKAATTTVLKYSKNKICNTKLNGFIKWKKNQRHCRAFYTLTLSNAFIVILYYILKSVRNFINIKWTWNLKWNEGI